MHNFRFYFIILLFVMYMIAILHLISLVFTTNTMIINLIMNTFDFWFMICNAMVGVTALWIRAFSNSIDYYQTVLGATILNWQLNVLNNLSFFWVVLCYFVWVHLACQSVSKGSSLDYQVLVLLQLLFINIFIRLIINIIHLILNIQI